MRFELNLKQLKVFYYAAKHLSFTRAAEELFITQPAVTMQISALERQYGLRLFLRRKNELSLTEAGTVLFSYAEKIMETAFEAERALFNLKANPHGVLRIGTTKTFARHLLAPYILRYQAAFPRVRIQVDEGSSEEMAMSVLYGRNDLAIVGRIPYPERLEAIPFPATPTDELVLIVPPSHRLAGRDRVSFHDLADEPLVLREKGSGTRHVIVSRLEGEGIAPRILLEAGNVDFIKDLVRTGAGVSIVGEISVREEVARGTLVALRFAEPLPIHIDVVLPKEGPRLLPVRSFLDFLLEEQAGAPPRRA